MCNLFKKTGNSHFGHMSNKDFTIILIIILYDFKAMQNILLQT